MPLQSEHSVELGQSRWAMEERLIMRALSKLGSQSTGDLLDEAKAIREVLHLMSELIGLNRGRVLLQSPNDKSLAIQYFYGLTKAQAEKGRFGRNEGVTGLAFASGQVSIVQDIDAEPLYLARSVDRSELPQETVSYIAMPFEIEGRIAGVLAAHRLRQRDRALSDDVDLMRIVAAWIGQILTVNRMIARRTASLEFENKELREQLRRHQGASAIIGRSALLMSALKQIEQVAASDATVLLLGESGTGKELFAHAVHSGSPRRDKPFIKVNCGAIPESLFESELFGHEKGAFTGALNRRIGRIEQADQGTLFLDEIGDLPLAMQVKLLRVLQDRVVEPLGASKEVLVNIRVVAATHRDLASLVAQGLFRLDLYYRLSVIPIRLPSLRERREDIAEIAWHYLKEVNRLYGKQASIRTDALASLADHAWPGNVRQLRNAVERLVLLADLPDPQAPVIDLGMTRALLESLQDLQPPEPDAKQNLVLSAGNTVIDKGNVLRTLASTNGNKSRAAQSLGLTLRQLNYRLMKWQISQ